ncbi:hypothetical protein BJX76DRAFT_339642 [Aspergillus varians]
MTGRAKMPSFMGRKQPSTLGAITGLIRLPLSPWLGAFFLFAFLLVSPKDHALSLTTCFLPGGTYRSSLILCRRLTMTPSLSWLSLVIALGIILKPGAAKECRGNYVLSGGNDTLQRLEDCTTIIGNIDLGERYWRSLSLPNTVNITGTITIRDPLRTKEGPGHSWVEGIETPELRYLGALLIYTSAGNVRMPKLKHVDDQITIALSDCWYPRLEFPSLVEAGSINIGPYFRSVNLDSLRSLANNLTIDYMVNNPEENGCRNPTPYAISLPSLESAGFLRISGILTNITLPELKSVGPPAILGPANTYPSGLRIQMDLAKEAFDLNLPKLESVEDQLHLYGKIKGVKMPSLRNTTAPIYISPSIQYAWFYGLEGFTSITINSTTNFDCSSPDGDLMIGQGGGPPNGPVTCSSIQPKSKLALKVGLGIGLSAVVVAGVVTWLTLFWKREMSNKIAPGTEFQNVLVQRETGGDATNRPSTPPPPYSPT